MKLVILFALLTSSAQSFAAGDIQPEGRVLCKVTSNLRSIGKSKSITQILTIPLTADQAMNGGDYGGSITLPKELAGYDGYRFSVSVSEQMRHGRPGSEAIKFEALGMNGGADSLQLTTSSENLKISFDCHWTQAK